MRHLSQWGLLNPMIRLSLLSFFWRKHSRNIVIIFRIVLWSQSYQLKNLSTLLTSLKMTFSQKEEHYLMAFEIIFIRMSSTTYISKRYIICEDCMRIVYCSKVLIRDEVSVLHGMNFI